MIQVKNLTYFYPYSDETPALSDLSFSIRRGELVLVTGPTAAGKTTLCLAIAGILQHEFEGTKSGSITFMGQDVGAYQGMSELNRHVSMVFDDADAQLIFTSVEEEILSGMQMRGWTKQEKYDRMEHILVVCGIAHLRDRPPYALSGGQKQRVAIAATLAMNTECIILDEPTSELDVGATGEIIQLLQALKQEGKTIIVVDHAICEYRAVADRVISMDKGKISATGTFDEIYPGPAACGSVLYSRDDLALYHPPAELSPVIAIQDLRKTYGSIPALAGVTTAIYPGEFVAILGENGSGKTTLVKHFNGLLRPDSGSIRVMDLDAAVAPVTDLVRHTGLVFQNPDAMLFADTVQEEIQFGLSTTNPGDETGIIDLVLAMVGLSGAGEMYPRHLSRGERQRLAVACILAMKPDIIVLDEPTTGLDEAESDAMMQLMERLQERGHTIIMVTHNMRIAETYAHRIICMENGRITGDYQMKGVCHD
ncbi:MAG: ABC transporter ATP-binding protein [Methanospirillaceae archaeon]|nr:ABC transporter ATP-binding protein [Methanospirillaceae archaeon]